MKKIAVGLGIMVAFCTLWACTKTSFITSKDALLVTSADTLHFDTVFTSRGSVAGRFKIFNPNSQKLLVSEVRLAGGAASFFKMNVDGVPGHRFTNLELAAGDSAYVFVSVTIDPNAGNLPFLVQDSIAITYNGNSKWVQLDAFGLNANFLRNTNITRNTTWTNNRPYVILGGLTVAPGITLTIHEGCRIFAHADAPIIVNGTLRVEGKRFDSTVVTFRGDRLDEGYRDYPGAWPGIYFGPASANNQLTYAIIKNAYQGIIVQQPVTGQGPKVTLNECIIDNVYDAGILCLNSSLVARNCLVTNCGFNIVLGAGGNYTFTHCTVSSFSNLFINHKNPVLTVTNAVDQTQGNPLTATFTNCIFYGDSGIVKNEIVTDRKGTAPYNVSFQSILYRNQQPPAHATVTNGIVNQPPQFDSIDNGRRYFNFRLKSTSPAINKGINTGLLFDLDGRPRGGAAGQPDLGAYEF